MSKITLLKHKKAKKIMTATSRQKLQSETSEIKRCKHKKTMNNSEFTWRVCEPSDHQEQ